MPNDETALVGRTTTSLAAADANVTDEVNRTGLALGDLVLRTGQAVAQTQNLLNQTSAATATALATTLVDVIAVQETIYDDQGNIDEVKTHTQKLPLINFIDPVFYQWDQVRLQGIFTASEFADAASSYGSKTSSSEASGQGGILVILGGGRSKSEYSSESSDSSSDSTRDLSYGLVRMNSKLTPRADIGVPKPRQAVQGPRLSIVQGEITDVLTSGKLTARTMSVLLEYTRRDGTPINGKAISIETAGVGWSVVGSDSPITDASGRIEILLRREFIGETPDVTPQEIVVSARIGLVQSSATVTL